MTHRSSGIPDVLQQDWSTKYQRVIDAARKFSPSKTISSLARLATAGDHPFADLTGAEGQVRTPWAIATLAKEALTRGNEHRHGTPPSDWATRLVRLFNSCGDMRSSPYGLPSLLAPMVFEQYHYQDSIKHELARTIALFGASGTPVGQQPSHLDWQSILGCTLKEFVQASLLLSHAAHLHRGHMPRQPYDPIRHEYINEILPPLALEHVTTLLTATPDDIRTAHRSGGRSTGAAQRFEYNPLYTTPILNYGAGTLLTPLPRLIAMAATPRNMYFRGVTAWSNPFANDFGQRLQTYVGRQLKSARVFTVKDELEYGPRKQRKDTIDWFAISADAVILIECKARRPDEHTRSGTTDIVDSYADRLNKARAQINRTHKLITDGDPAVSDIPNDRPIYGLVVTSENYFFANEPSLASRLEPASIPILALSLRDLESWLSISPHRILPTLKSVMCDGSAMSGTLEMAIAKEHVVGNVILDAEWEKLPFAQLR